MKINYELAIGITIGFFQAWKAWSCIAAGATCGDEIRICKQPWKGWVVQEWLNLNLKTKKFEKMEINCKSFFGPRSWISIKHSCVL